MSNLIIYQDRDHAEFMTLDPAVRTRVMLLFKVAQRLHACPKGGRTALCKELAKEMNLSFNGLYSPVNAFLKGGDWRVMVDKRKNPELWCRTKTTGGLPHDFIEFWKTCAENNTRSISASWDFLILRLENWRRGDFLSAIPGYASPPPNAPGKTHPKGWSLRDLTRKAPKAVELDAVRAGRSAALAHAPQVLTTRKTGYPFQEIQFDDMWHDIKVLYGTQLVRILEFGCIDWYSTYYFPPVLKPRVNMDGVNKGLSERDFRLYAVHLLATVGWSPRGTVLRGERGTAAFRNGLADKLSHWSHGLLTVPLPGMSGHAALPGGYSELAKGNFHLKALKEGRGKLIHNYLAAVAGQTGMDPDHTPAGESGRDKESLVLATLQGLTKADFKFSHLTFEQGVNLIYQATALINARTNHNNEGWLEEGLITQDILVSPEQDLWMPAATADRRYLAELAELAPHRLRTRRMSATEVITPYLGETLKLTPEAIADCIFDDTRRKVQVEAARLSFVDQDMGLGTFRYPAYYQGRDGFTKHLDTGEEVYLCVNPFDSENGYLFNLRGQYLARVRRDHGILRADTEALKRAAGEQQRVLNNLTLSAQVRQGLKRESAMTHNARELEEIIRTDIRREMGMIQPATQAAPAIDLSEEYAAAGQPTAPAMPYDDPSILL